MALLLLFTLKIITTTSTIFDCRTKQCLYEAMICDDNEPCFVDCGYNLDTDKEQQEACQYSLIHCPINAKCEVNCDANEACDRAIIFATHSTQLNLTCNGYIEACSTTKILCPNHGKCIIEANNTNNEVLKWMYIYTAYGLNNVYLSTTSALVNNITVQCGSNYKHWCSLLPQAPYNTCKGSNPYLCTDLSTADVNESVLLPISNIFNCDAAYECKSQTLRCNDNTSCYVHCAAYESCEYAVIYCPFNATCAVSCDSYEACKDMRIYAAHAAQLDLICFDDTQSCDDISIICPKGLKSCNIMGYNDVNDVFHDMVIFAMNGMDVIAFNHSSTLQSNIVIICGVNYETYYYLSSGSFACDSYQSCQWVHIQCPINKKCEVNCSAREACEYATINAVKSTELSITCSDYKQSCKDIEIFCPVDSVSNACKITGYAANYDDVFEGMNIYAVNGEYDLVVNASLSLENHIIIHAGTEYDAVYSINNVFDCSWNRNEFHCSTYVWTEPDAASQRLLCKDDLKCIINCGSTAGDARYHRACKHSIIMCPINHSCEVKCGGNQACEYARINATQSTELSITCLDYESCKDTEVFCPTDTASAQCIITAYSDTYDDVIQDMNIFIVDLNNLEINASAALKDTVIVGCGSNYSSKCDVNNHFDCRTNRCLKETIICTNNRDCSVDCAFDDLDGDNRNNEACQDAHIECPANARCEVICNASEACERLYINATLSTELDVSCGDHIESCFDAHIYCPVNVQNCHIYGDNDVNDVFSGMEIFAVNGFNDVTFAASSTLKSDVIIYCGLQYDDSCSINSTAPFNVCSSGSFICDQPITTETASNPTILPTMHPSRIPSVFATDAPSNYPTVYPTISPSNHPIAETTTNPTLSPIVADISTTEQTMDPTQYRDITLSTNPLQTPSIPATTEPTIYHAPSSDPTSAPITAKLPTFLSSDEPTSMPNVFDISVLPTINNNRDGKVDEFTTSALYDYNSDEDEIKNNVTSFTDKYWMFIVLLCVLCVILCGAYVLNLRRKMSKVIQEQVTNMDSEIAAKVIIPQASVVQNKIQISDILMNAHKEKQCVALYEDQEGGHMTAGADECDNNLTKCGEAAVTVNTVNINDNVTAAGFDTCSGNLDNNAMHFVNAAEMDQVVIGDDEDEDIVGDTQK